LDEETLKPSCALSGAVLT